MKKFLLLLLLTTAGLAQNRLMKTYRLGETASLQKGLAGNGISDIKEAKGVLWFGTGHGLSRTVDGGETFETFLPAQGLGHGSVSGLYVQGDTILVATATDTLTAVSDQYLSKGTGLSVSLDGGDSWTHFPQPGVTPVQNLAYDVEVVDGVVWIACFGGGLIQSKDGCRTWQVAPPDTFVFNPSNRLNHRAFSLTVGDGALYVGTAEGVNKSLDNGRTWVNFNHTNQKEPISGNFVTALAFQKTAAKSIIWAASWKAEGDDEFYAVSKSENGGLSWQTMLRDEQAHNFAFDGSVVYVACNSGLFKSTDYGAAWYLFPAIKDAESSNRVYDSETDSAWGRDGVLWVGTTDGLARTNDNGYSWKIFRAFQPTGAVGQPRTYAYPNPFSPTRHNQLGGDGHVRFQYNTLTDTRVTIQVFDYAMDLVATVCRDAFRHGPADYSDVWNGRNDYGDAVANGVYFYRIDLENDGAHWGKVMVVN
ncbi:MAG: Two component regulator propeller [bacterium ADurb.Bin478]|nr:MAG: Two component regulator propeller [bacterium ADurb.Bin478]